MEKELVSHTTTKLNDNFYALRTKTVSLWHMDYGIPMFFCPKELKNKIDCQYIFVFIIQWQISRK